MKHLLIASFVVGALAGLIIAVIAAFIRIWKPEAFDKRGESKN